MKRQRNQYAKSAAGIERPHCIGEERERRPRHKTLLGEMIRQISIISKPKESRSTNRHVAKIEGETSIEKKKKAYKIIQSNEK